ncbi:hypothetical protein DFJ73DRAFT_793904 [Zopfochytrium polystomum]|nr:hypothetical protein DFJ73DRAFT_793904 [Zopfochytrium polystomum]
MKQTSSTSTTTSHNSNCCRRRRRRLGRRDGALSLPRLVLFAAAALLAAVGASAASGDGTGLARRAQDKWGLAASTPPPPPAAAAAPAAAQQQQPPAQPLAVAAAAAAAAWSSPPNVLETRPRFANMWAPAPAPAAAAASLPNGSSLSSQQQQPKRADVVGSPAPAGMLAAKTDKSLVADAVPSPSSDPLTDGTAQNGLGVVTHLNIYTGIGAAILIATGIALVFFGHRIFKAVLFIAVEYKTGNLFAGGGDHRDLIYLIVCLVAGFAGGFLMMCLWKLGLAVIGALLGFVLATIILSFVSGGTISSGIGRSIFILLMTLAFSILIQFFERPLLILATAATGAFALVVGLDIFVGTGFTDAAHTFLSGSGTFTVTWKTFLMMALFLLLTVIGSVAFFRDSERGAYGNVGEKK